MARLVLQEKWSPQAVADSKGVNVGKIREYIRSVNGGELPKTSFYLVTKGDKRKPAQDQIT